MERDLRSSSSHAPPLPFVEVAVAAMDVRGARTFHYLVPPELGNVIAAGQLVQVEFGQRQLHGIVLAMSPQSPVMDPKPIIDVVVEAPLLDARGLEFARWLARSFGSPIAACLENLLPPSLERYLIFSYSHVPAAGEPLNPALPKVERSVLELLEQFGPLTQDELVRRAGKLAAARVLPKLLKAGRVQRRAELRLPTGGVRAAALAVPLEAAATAIAGMRNAPKRRALLELLAKRRSPIPLKELLETAQAAAASLRPLVEAGLVRVEDVYRLPRPDPSGPRDEPPALSDEAAWRAIQSFIDRDGHAVALLLGEIGDRLDAYVRSAESVVGAGRQVLALAPTEAQAAELYRALAGRVSGQVALLSHARTPAQRVGLWRSIRAGEIDVVIGARSAVFAPLARLGLVIVDREEDRNYKDRRAARVQARDAAIQLGRLHRCPVMLGSDTPSVATFHNVEQERYRFILMGSAGLLRATRLKVGRGWGSQRPAGVVDVVDLRGAPAMGHGGMISEHLYGALAEAAAAGENAVLFVNRRGTASLTVCQECGYIFGCPNCSTNLVQHTSFGGVVCHVCNHREPIPKACPDCGSRRLRLWGHGTEAVTEALKRLFPAERIERIDGDVNLESVRRIADGFRVKTIRFLVGTSLLFNLGDALRCGIAGVVQADLGLGFPDFTAPERVFQTLMRLRRLVLGGGLEGKMILQSIMPDHHVIEAVRIGSYLRFFRTELEIRRLHAFPPLRRLVRFVFAHPSADKARLEAENLASSLRLASPPSGDVQLLGPAPCFLHRERGKYRWHIIALGPDPELEGLMEIPHRGWVVDADPVDLA